MREGTWENDLFKEGKTIHPKKELTKKLITESSEGDIIYPKKVLNIKALSSVGQNNEVVESLESLTLNSEES